jgi:hypothetical protein
MKMNLKTRTLLTLILISICGIEAAAQSPAPCRPVKASWLDTLSATGTTGTVTNGGVLNGTTETVYNPAFVFTPDPNVVAYIAETTFTTTIGILKTSNVYLYNFITGVGTAMGRIDPNASTGKFAGATGDLYFNTKTIGAGPSQSYLSEISGQICSTN